MKCRFVGPLPMGAIPVFEKRVVNGQLDSEVWMLDESRLWIQTDTTRIVVQLHDVAVYPFDMPLTQERKLNERFIYKHAKPFFEEENGRLTIVHRGRGMTGLAWSTYPLLPSRNYHVDLKNEPPPWWNVMV